MEEEEKLESQEELLKALGLYPTHKLMVLCEEEAVIAERLQNIVEAKALRHNIKLDILESQPMLKEHID
jgi:hypothetical protein